MIFDQLFEFQTLAQTLHYGKAAEKLYITQSVLSRHIQSLEQELGVQLFYRNSHSVSLTAAGEALKQHSSDFLQSIALSREKVHSAGIGVAGSVRFGCFLPVMRDAIKDYLRYFCDTYPEIVVNCDILIANSDQDLASYHCLVTPSSAIKIPDCFQHRTTLYEKGYLVLPPNHWVHPGAEASLSMLVGETLFIPGYHGTIGSFARIRQMAEQATCGQVHIIRVPNPETALLNVILGKGFTVLPRHLLDEQARNVPYTTIKEGCRFELMFYQNTSVDEPASQLLADEFCRLLDVSP